MNNNCDFVNDKSVSAQHVLLLESSIRLIQVFEMIRRPVILQERAGSNLMNTVLKSPISLIVKSLQCYR